MGIYKDRVTIYEVAKAAGVSLATVSRVINNQSNVRPDTKQKVEETIARLGYKPNALAQGLATNRTTNIGIVIPDVNYVHISNLLSGMIDIGKIYGYQTTLFITKHSKQDTRDVIAKLVTSHVDGAVVFDDELEEDDIKNIISYNIPLVVIGRDVIGEKVGCITIDFVKTLSNVLQKAVEDGKTIKFIKASTQGNMISSVDEELENSLPKGSCETFTITDSYHETYSTFVDFFKKNKNTNSVYVAPRDSLACAIENAATDLGMKVPEDVQVVSIVGTKYSYLARPTISSCDIDMYEIGSIAMRMVTKILKDELKDKKFSFEAKFTSRGSTKY
jgi:LacI family transcriptional regulator